MSVRPWDVAEVYCEQTEERIFPGKECVSYQHKGDWKYFRDMDAFLDWLEVHSEGFVIGELDVDGSVM